MKYTVNTRSYVVYPNKGVKPVTRVTIEADFVEVYGEQIKFYDKKDNERRVVAIFKASDVSWVLPSSTVTAYGGDI